LIWINRSRARSDFAGLAAGSKLCVDVQPRRASGRLATTRVQRNSQVPEVWDATPK
jgi:hypothetical protein